MPTITITSTTSSTTTVPCRSDPDLWFAEHDRHLQVAKRACGPCPLRRPCLEGALQRREPAGVWGGEVLVDGVVVAVKRGRGRPPRTARVA